MKNTFLKTIGTAALAILMMAAFAQVRVSAQTIGNEESTRVNASQGLGAGTLEGSWNVQVTPRNCQTGATIGATTPSMLTFMQGGTMQETGTRIAPSLRGPGHGVWRSQFGLNYTATFQFFRFNADGTLAGRQIVIQQTTLNPFDGSFTSTATAQIFDAGGNVIANNCSTGVGTRFE